MLQPNSNLFIAHNKDNRDVCTAQRHDQLVFVRYYDILGENKVPNERRDESLGCIRLKWERHVKDE